MLSSWIKNPTFFILLCVVKRGVLHWGMNLGDNTAEAVNFVMKLGKLRTSLSSSSHCGNFGQ